MRDTNRMLRYQDIMDKQAITINHYKDNYVARELHEENLNNFLELKEQYELAQARLKQYEKDDNKELQKQLQKEEKEKAKKKAEIEKKRKELEELEASI